MAGSAVRGVGAYRAILIAAMLGWTLDAFDFTMLLFLVPHLREVFGVSLPAMAFVITATGLAKVVGTIGWGALADRVGRKLPFILAILWFSCFSGLSGLAWSYGALLALRILFGLGFGGEWSVSAALLTETVPAELAGLASGIMMLGYEIGYLLAALAFRTVFPVLGWRWMFFLGVLPALFALFVRRHVAESPTWRAGGESGARRERLKLTPAVIQAWAFMAFLNFMSWAIFALYPTFLITVRHLDPAGVFPFIATYSVASIIGKPLAGRPRCEDRRARAHRHLSRADGAVGAALHAGGEPVGDGGGCGADGADPQQHLRHRADLSRAPLPGGRARHRHWHRLGDDERQRRGTLSHRAGDAAFWARRVDGRVHHLGRGALGGHRRV
jgi:MFS family permease